MTTSARMSSTTTTVSMNARSRSGNAGRARAAWCEAVSVDTAIPQPCARGAASVGRDRWRPPAPCRRCRRAAARQTVAVPADLRGRTRDAPRARVRREERHQAAVHPVTQIQGDACVTEVDRQRRLPRGLVGRRVDVPTDERRNSCHQQDRRAAGLGAQELTKRRLQVPRPCRPSCNGDGPAFGSALLLVALHDLRPPDVGRVRVATSLAQRTALPQQIPALVERNLQLAQAFRSLSLASPPPRAPRAHARPRRGGQSSHGSENRPSLLPGRRRGHEQPAGRPIYHWHRPWPSYSTGKASQLARR